MDDPGEGDGPSDDEHVVVPRKISKLVWLIVCLLAWCKSSFSWPLCSSAHVSENLDRSCV